MEYVGTVIAAFLLGITDRRLRYLLQQGRVKGAYKCGHFWLIPLRDGLPEIAPAKHGQPGTWNTNKTPKKTIVHINSKNIRDNIHKKPEEREPVIAVKGNNKFYAHQLEIPYPCRIVYEPDNSKKYGGARVWIEILGGQDLYSIQPIDNLQKSK